ncbi:MAG: hypothetical protein A4E28_00987 [Methanocella sp. PtaU1.Bin125]|nr:MAG: hypothetical protein A4E28_00987 [Methanocella sp. PtaU1.Bin125]
MLQSCSPGLAVVNIDNGFNAGATTALIAGQSRKKQAFKESSSIHFWHPGRVTGQKSVAPYDQLR